MQRRTRRLLVAALLAVAVAALIGYQTRPAPVAVLVAPVERAKVEATVANTRAGSVETCQRARLAPAMGGQVARLLVKKGDEVRKGQPLMELWSDDLAAQLRLAESESRAAKARSEEACVQAGIAARDQQRSEQLFLQQLISEEQRDRTHSTMQATAAACSAARASVQVSINRIALVKAQLERTRITAPFSGVVAEITGEPGEYVTPSPPGIPTPPAVDLVDPACLYVIAPIDEIDAPRVKLGMAARITLDAFGNQAFSGEVRRIAPYVLNIEKQARTVDVDVYFNPPEQIGTLLPGYSADVEIILDARDNTLRIPSEAVLERNRVLVYDPQSDTLSERPIEAGLTNWQYTEVISGLQAHEQVVTSVQRDGVKAGAKVTLESNTP
ncbi:MAG TPA: efflux RND transporter periplasmic adaptor subunit [Gammaproteobacteria bacterium]